MKIWRRLFCQGLAIFFVIFAFQPVKGETNQWFHNWGCTVENQILSLTEPPLSSHEIYELEERLVELGYDPGPVDGVFDLLTEKGVKEFQQDEGLKPDGIVNADLWQALAKDNIQPTTKSDTPPEEPIKIVIDLDRQKLTILSQGAVFKEYPVAIGKSDTPSPVGEWRIVNKSTNWGGGFGSRWLGLNVPWGIYGIHGTNKPWSIGREASHGCFRMFNRDVEEIFPWIQYGAPVEVIGTIKYFPWHKTRSLQLGSTGPDVVALQLKLKEEGLLWGAADGRFGELTELAIKYFQTLYGLANDGLVEESTRKALNL